LYQSTDKITIKTGWGAGAAVKGISYPGNGVGIFQAFPRPGGMKKGEILGG